jgi:hypothetical protein
MKHILLSIIFAFTLSSSLFAEEFILDDSADKQQTEETTNDITVTFLNGKLTVENAPQNSQVEIFSMLGVSVFQATITESKQYFLVDLKKGYYIVKASSLTKKISVK